MASVLAAMGVTEEKFAPVCVAGSGVYALGSRVNGLEFRVYGLGFRV